MQVEQLASNAGISKRLLKKLHEAFPRPDIKPGFDRDTLIDANAKHSVVLFIEAWLNAQSNRK